MGEGNKRRQAHFIIHRHCTGARLGLLSTAFIELNYWANQKVQKCQLTSNYPVLWGSYCQCLFKYEIHIHVCGFPMVMLLGRNWLQLSIM